MFRIFRNKNKSAPKNLEADGTRKELSSDDLREMIGGLSRVQESLNTLVDYARLLDRIVTRGYFREDELDKKTQESFTQMGSASGEFIGILARLNRVEKVPIPKKSLKRFSNFVKMNQDLINSGTDKKKWNKATDKMGDFILDEPFFGKSEFKKLRIDVRKTAEMLEKSYKESIRGA
ncbi:MAG: hypothetical protein KGH71_01385 [Candidatus Micrarchaeota archaeon]|nr:hypothetical protein [Candidatus Micrarchaeota archaeon]